MTPDDEITRGNQARAVLSDKMYQESWSAVEEQLVKLLRQVDIDPEKERRVLYTLKGLSSARRYLESVMQSGKMAAATIEQDRKFAERVMDKIKTL